MRPLCICYFFRQSEFDIFLSSIGHIFPLFNQPLRLFSECVCPPDGNIGGSAVVLGVVSPLLGHHRAARHALKSNSPDQLPPVSAKQPLPHPCFSERGTLH